MASDSANLPCMGPPCQTRSRILSASAYLPCMRAPAKHISRCARPSMYMHAHPTGGVDSRTPTHPNKCSAAAYLPCCRWRRLLYEYIPVPVRCSAIGVDNTSKKMERVRGRPARVHIACTAPVTPKEWVSSRKSNTLPVTSPGGAISTARRECTPVYYLFAHHKHSKLPHTINSDGYQMESFDMTKCQSFDISYRASFAPLHTPRHCRGFIC